MKPPHPVEAFEASIIANAASWTAFQFRGAGDRQKHECATREEALAAARAMLADYDKAVMIYAVSASGRQALAETIRR